MTAHGKKNIIWKMERNLYKGGWNVYGDIGLRHYDEINREKCRKLYTQEYRELNEFILFALS